MPPMHGSFCLTLNVPNLPVECEGVYFALGQISLKRAASPTSPGGSAMGPGEPGEPAAQRARPSPAEPEVIHESPVAESAPGGAALRPESEAEGGAVLEHEDRGEAGTEAAPGAPSAAAPAGSTPMPPSPIAREAEEEGGEAVTQTVREDEGQPAGPAMTFEHALDVPDSLPAVPTETLTDAQPPWAPEENPPAQRTES